jgi:hypothetical protein
MSLKILVALPNRVRSVWTQPSYSRDHHESTVVLLTYYKRF